MKIIHCADIHIGSAMTSKFNKEKADIRRREVLMSFVKMVDYAANNDVEAIIIAGDLFDSCDVVKSDARTIIELIQKYSEIDFYYLAGNHEKDGFISRLKKVPDNLLLFNEEWLSYIANDRRKGNVVVTGIDANNLYGRTVAVRTKELADWLELDEEDINIIVLHGEFEPGYFSGHFIDYMALGHIHEYREGRIDARGTWCYSGCLTGRGFDECGKHGFVLIDVDEENSIVRKKFVQISERKTEIIEVDVSECRTDLQIIDAVTVAVGNRGINSDSVVRVILYGEVDADTTFDIVFIEKMMGERFFYLEIEDKIRVRLDDSYMKNMTLKGEFVRTVMKKTEISEADRQEIIRIGLRALAGEEI